MHSTRAIRIAVAALVSSAIAVGPALADSVSLPKAVDLGLARSPELGQAQARVGAAEAGRDQASREWFPKVDLTAAVGYRHLDNDVRVQLGLSSIEERPRYATIGLQQPVWDFGRRGSAINLQKSRLASSQWDELAAGEAASFAISRAYLQVFVQQKIVAAARENVEFHRNLAADVGEGVERGAMSISERQQANERYQGAQIALQQANADLNSARAELELLVGISQFELTAPPDPTGIMPKTLDEALAIAATHDPRLLSVDEKFRGAGWNAARARRERLPNVGLQGTIRAGKDFEGYRGTTKDYELQLVMRWNVFDGGVAAAKVREADHATDEARFAFGQAQRDSELAVRRSWISMDNWHAKLDSQHARLLESRAVRESYRAQFGIGRRSLLDLLDAQNAVFNATVETEIAQTGMLLSQYGLLGQLGQLRSFFGAGKPKVDPQIYGPK